jgi:Flp pilus assembly protein TadG
MTAIAKARRSLHTDRRAGVAVFIALLFPALIAMGLLAIDAVRAFSQATLLSTATQAAALAGGMNIGNYYSQGATLGSATISAEAALIGDANAASSANLSSAIQLTQLGNWNTSNSTFTSLTTSGTTSPNAVLVTGTLTMPTYIGGAFGTPTISITKTATATFNSSTPFNVMILNDMGGPNTTQSLGIPGSAQALWWAQQQAADLAILRCLKAAGNTSTKFGVTGFVEQAYTLQAMTTVNSGTNATTIANNISNSGGSNFQYCRQSKTAKMCHGSNVAAAIKSAIAQFNNITTAGASNNIVILTNELPIYDPTVATGQSPVLYYTAAEGTGVTIGTATGPTGAKVGTGSSSTALCGNSPVCTTSNLIQMAEGQAAAAGLATSSGGPGLRISVIYFSGDNGTVTGQAATDWAEISSWAQNGGLVAQTSSLTTTTANGTTTLGVAAQAGKFCQLLGSTLATASN